MSERVERVARAIYEESGEDVKLLLFGKPVKSWDEVVAGVENGEVVPIALDFFREKARLYVAALDRAC